MGRDRSYSENNHGKLIVMLDHLCTRQDEICEIATKNTLLVVGNNKSGTTWVQKMLNTHPEIFCAGEGKFQILLQGFLKAIADHNKAVTVTNQVVYSDKAYYRAWDNNTVATAVQFLLALMWQNSDHKEFSQVRYVGDKDTEYYRSINDWRKLLLADARIVHVIRDVRDCIISFRNHMQRSGHNIVEPDSDEFYIFLRNYAKRWAEKICSIREACCEQPRLYHEVRYEDLLEAPEKYVMGILAFLEVDASNTVVRQIVLENTFKKLSGGREAGQEDRASFYRKGVSGDWMHTFTPRAKQIIADTSGKLLEELGYAV